MKLVISALALGVALTALAPAAQARSCAGGIHHGHCVMHRRLAYKHHWRHVHRYGHGHITYNMSGWPQAYYYPGYYYPGYYYPGYALGEPYYYPTPQPYGYANQIQYLMNAEGDPPYAEIPRYSYSYGWRPY